MENINLVEILKFFGETPVPLGVCITTVFVVIAVFWKMQDMNVKHYSVIFENSKILFEQNKVLFEQRNSIQDSYVEEIKVLSERVGKLKSENQSLENQVMTWKSKYQECEKIERR